MHEKKSTATFTGELNLTFSKQLDTHVHLFSVSVLWKRSHDKLSRWQHCCFYKYKKTIRLLKCSSILRLFSHRISFVYFPYIPTQSEISWLLVSHVYISFHWLHGAVSVAITHTVTQLKTSAGWNWSYLLGWTVTSVTCWLGRLGQHEREVGCNHGWGSPINGPLGFTLDQYRDFTSLHMGLCGKQN